MIAYILRRLVSAVSVIIAVIVVSFLLFFAAPTDPAAVLCGAKCTPDKVASIEHGLGLDQPVPVQLGLYLKGIVAGRTIEQGAGASVECPAPCLGYSFQLGRPVTELLGRAIPVTISIVLVATVIYFALGVIAGVIAARRRGTPLDRAVVAVSLGLGSVPYPVVAVLSAVYIAGPWLPQEGWVPITESPTGWFLGLSAAWLTLIIINSSQYVRYSRNSMIDSLGEDYIRTARAKGLGEGRVIYGHGLRAAITPLVTLFGLDLAFGLTGALFTETIFGLPGLGYVTLRAFTVYDLPVMMGGVIIGSVLLVVMNLVVDLLYTVLDPRVRLT